MFRQQTRTFYDNNELKFREIIREKPMQYITTDYAATYRGPHFIDTKYNVNISNELREQPTRLNYFNRNVYNPDDPKNDPYGNTLLHKSINTESNLLLNGDPCDKSKINLRNSSYNQEVNNFFKLTPQTGNLFPTSSRNYYRNTYTCR